MPADPRAHPGAARSTTPPIVRAGEATTAPISTSSVDPHTSERLGRSWSRQRLLVANAELTALVFAEERYAAVSA